MNMDIDREISIKLVKKEDFPDSLGGVCIEYDGTDSYLMFINGNKDEQQQIANFLHECLHIWHRDYERKSPSMAIEKEREEEILQLLELMRRNI